MADGFSAWLDTILSARPLLSALLAGAGLGMLLAGVIALLRRRNE